MLLRLCQLKSQICLLLLFHLIFSCSNLATKDARESEVLTGFNAQWFKKNKHHSLEDNHGRPLAHLLFDVDSEFNFSTQEVNVVITTPKDSVHAYDIDMSSGQRFYTHSYCKQGDIWKTYSGSISRPPYSIAYIPKVLDQMGEAQKVIVWSSDPKITEIYKTNYIRVRLVGAYVEQMCPQGNCIGTNDWLSKLVFLAVDVNDSSFQNVKTIDDLNQSINWSEVKAHLANVDGQNFIGPLIYPYKQIGDPISFEKAFGYFKKRSIILTNDELEKVQNSCYLLYDKFLEDVGKFRAEDFSSKTLEEHEQKIKLKKGLRDKNLPVGFAERLARFVKKYFKEMSTCEKFVYHGNINLNTDDFWFLNYMGIYFRLHREGYFYDCKNQSWQKNEIDDRGKAFFSLTKTIDECSEMDFDLAMGYLSNFINGLKSDDHFYRFIDYDMHYFGTHSKLYSWVKLKVQRFDCWEDPNQQILKKMQVVPENNFWKKRYEKDITEKLKVIY